MTLHVLSVLQVVTDTVHESIEESMVLEEYEKDAL